MDRSLLIAGATGLVGSAVLSSARLDEFFSRIIVLTRREIPEMDESSRIAQRVVDFSRLDEYYESLAAHTVVCALGTTAKKAGTKERFFTVDYEYPLQLARIALSQGARHFILVSSVGANPRAGNFYLSMKGNLENEIAEMGYENLDILRPSLLLGKRTEFRFAECIGQRVAPALSFLLPERYRPIEV